MANFMNGSNVSMGLVNPSNNPLNALEVANDVNEVLTNLPIYQRYVGQAVFCEAENCVYRFTKHDDGTGTGTLTSGILDTDFQPDSSGGAMKIATNTILGQVIIKLDGGIKVDSKGFIWIDGYTTATTTDPITGDITTTTTIGGVTTTVTTDPAGNPTSTTINIGGGAITSTTATDPTTGNTTTTAGIGNVNTTTTTDPTGTVITNTADVAGVTTSTVTDPTTGDTYSQVGDKVVSGSKPSSTTSTTTDPITGAVTTTKVDTIQTPTGTQQTTTITTTDPTTGNTTTSTEVVTGGSDGVDVGRSDGTITTVVTDPTGGTISSESNDVAYNNGNQELWANNSDVDAIIGGFGGSFGWDF